MMRDLVNAACELAPTCSLLAIAAQDWAKQRSPNPEKDCPHPSTHSFVQYATDRANFRFRSLYRVSVRGVVGFPAAGSTTVCKREMNGVGWDAWRYGFAFRDGTNNQGPKNHV
ncbi:hypothetical protein GE21DRAFT_1004931 [Neurospora crassa]|nr:hypothetical protein GE21DRAFT_1004931 [Neurospora crassa]